MSYDGLAHLRQKVDTFMQRIADKYPGQMACRPGCSHCCNVDLAVFPAESTRLEAALACLPEATRLAVLARAQGNKHCVFLVDDHCVVYEERPIICRSQGLPLLLEDSTVAMCHLNFANQDEPGDIPREDILNLKTLNVLMSVIHRVHIKADGLPDQRVRLVELVADASDPGESHLRR